MGSSASKASRAAGSATRKYPTKPSAQTSAPAQYRASPATPSRPGPTVHPAPQATEEKTAEINIDASDPVYASNLRNLGVVDSNPFHSNSSVQNPSKQNHIPDFAPPTNSRNLAYDNNSPFPYPSAANMDPASNPALRILQARGQLQDQADKEFENVGRRNFQGRQFLDVTMVSQVLLARKRGAPDQEIEKRMGLRAGIVGRLGKNGVVEAISLGE
ncbi:Aspartate-tRNA ligase [Venturia nashicola]|uniref:Aspartate--tRNA ligase n=1 Tax=Venturia nashicola TaxID=86259 RepID=A0A4Z1PC09_9PEZI|nr:Aspartate--tRNA ligase [Venturia nashicola]TLD35551.1 Aspartate-tRNA ligase [Venturia nashicola]